MAYKNLIKQTVLENTESFKRVRDFVCARNGSYDYTTSGIGWTLHDSSYSVDQHNIVLDDYFVIYSQGESGDEELYYKFTYTTNVCSFQMKTCLYWNNSTHTPVMEAAGVPVFTTTNVEREIWIYGDLSSVSFIAKTGVSYYAYYIGKAEELIADDTPHISTEAVSSGTDVVISLNTIDSGWFVGQGLFIKDNADIEKIVIKAISGLDITVDVTGAFSPGCSVKGDYSQLIQSGTAFLSMYGIINHLGNKLSTYVNLNPTVAAGYITTALPDELSSQYLARKIFMADGAPDMFGGAARNVLQIGSAGLTKEDVVLVGSEEYRYFQILATSIYVLFKEV